MDKKNFSKKYVSLILFSVLMLSYTYVCMTKYCFSSAMVFIVDEGYMTNFQTGLIGSGFWLAYAIFQPFGGMMADRWHPERLITLGFVAAGIANVIIFNCYENYALTLTVWMLNAACQFGVWPSVFKIISSMYSGKELINAMVISSLATPGGIMLSYLVAAIVPRWQDGFVVSFVGLFVAAILWVIVSRSLGDYIKSLKLTKEHIKKDEQNNFKIANDKNGMTMSKLLIPSGIILVFSFEFLRAVIGYVKNFVPSMISSAYEQVDPSMSTVMTLIPLVCGAAGPVFSHFLAQKVEDEIKAAILISSVMLPFSLVTLFLGRISYWFIILAMAVVSFGAAAICLFTFTLVATKFNKWGKGATVSGLLNAFAAVGNVAASAFITWLVDFSGTWRLPLVVFVILIAVSFVILLIELPIWKKFKRQYYYEHE